MKFEWKKNTDRLTEKKLSLWKRLKRRKELKTEVYKERQFNKVYI